VTSIKPQTHFLGYLGCFNKFFDGFFLIIGVVSSIGLRIKLHSISSNFCSIFNKLGIGFNEDGSSDSPIEIAADKEPTIEIAPTASPEDEAPALEINDLSAVSLEEKADIENAKEEETPKAPVLDLGEDEISLELDEDPEPESPPTPPVQIDELDLNLEIDDSEGPLSTANTETPEIEIEDLGLELEDSDSPPDSEKP